MESSKKVEGFSNRMKIAWPELKQRHLFKNNVTLLEHIAPYLDARRWQRRRD
jgi:hypothetical protein